MRAASSLAAAFAIALFAFSLIDCAGNSDNGPTILSGMDMSTDSAHTDSSDSRLRSAGVEGPILLPFRDPTSGGVAYRLKLEVEGERAVSRSPDNTKPPPVREAHSLEAEFRKLPVEDANSAGEMFLVGLDGLLYTHKQQNPAADREIELADDRLRIKVNGETSVDNRGNRVVGPLAPRALLNRIFGVITHDPDGNPVNLSSRGAPAARELMDQIPLLGAIAYTMVSLPHDPIGPGSSWTGVRIPPSRSGELGFGLPIDFTLAGFETFEDVPCAMILLNADINEKAFTGVTGFKFDHVRAALHGTAWVELDDSRVRRLALSDQIMARWTDPGDPRMAAEHQIRHSSKIELTLRDPNRRSKKWSDGTPRFDNH